MIQFVWRRIISKVLEFFVVIILMLVLVGLVALAVVAMLKFVPGIVEPVVKPQIILQPTQAQKDLPNAATVGIVGRAKLDGAFSTVDTSKPLPKARVEVTDGAGKKTYIDLDIMFKKQPDGSVVLETAPLEISALSPELETKLRLIATSSLDVGVGFRVYEFKLPVVKRELDTYVLGLLNLPYQEARIGVGVTTDVKSGWSVGLGETLSLAKGAATHTTILVTKKF